MTNRSNVTQDGMMACNSAIACHGEAVCHCVMVFHGKKAVVCDSAAASLPEPETTVTMLYRGVGGAIAIGASMALTQTAVML
jgi:hypothetical protein